MTVAVGYRIDAAPNLPADAPTVVLSGSLGSTLDMWAPQVPGLSQRFRVVRYDIRGHGRSPMAGTTCCIDDLADDLLALLDHLQLTRVHLVGLSLGGMTAMKVAARNPLRVDKLAVMCTSALLGPAQGWLDRAATVRAHGTGAIAAAVVERWFTPGFSTAHPGIVASHQAMIASNAPAGYAACCEAIASMDLRADLPKITAATLVLAGAQDRATPPPHQEAIAAAVPDACLQMLDPGAHLANVEQPEQTTAALLRHFAESTGSKTS